MLPYKTNFFFELKALFSRKDLVETMNQNDLKIQTDETMNMNKQLCASLKHLEFISFFETHIDKRNEESYSLSFLQELKNIKYSTQMNVIELLNYKKK
tara:strand:- start:300 stop:593 length:294 start_codon:yes stop_codon:yes gene_type:complete